MTSASVVTGVVSVLRTLDRESISVYHLNMSATDSGTPAMTSYTLLHVHVDDVNDNAPVFLRRTYRAVVDEEQDPPVAVVTVSATDFDDPTSISFLILCLFVIDEVIVYTVSPKKQDTKLLSCFFDSRCRLIDCSWT